MKITELEIQNAKILEKESFEDNRGKSIKFYSKEEFDASGIDFTPLEVMNIHSNKSTLRGLHYQKVYGQSKVLNCYNGKLFVVVVDVLSSSETYGKWCSVILDSSQKMIYIPKECAVGTLAMEDADFICMCGDNPFMKEYDSGIKWDDRTLNIDWKDNGIDKIISMKDENLSTFDQIG